MLNNDGKFDPKKKSVTKLESLSSLPLQMALHFNVYLIPFIFLSTFLCLHMKFSYLSITYQVILIAVYIVYYLVEIVRLLLGYFGNLGEKIPALSGFWITSLVLQLPITLFLQINSSIFPLPLERAVFGIHLILLLIQLVSGFYVIKAIAARQVLLFKALLSEEIQENN